MKKTRTTLDSLAKEAEALTRERAIDRVCIIPGEIQEETNAVYEEFFKRRIPYYSGKEITHGKYSIDMRKIELIA